MEYKKRHMIFMISSVYVTPFMVVIYVVKDLCMYVCMRARACMWIGRYLGM